MKKITFSLLVAGMTLLSSGNAMAQNVIYPGELQAGTAQLAATDKTYTLSNNLLSVSFIEEGTTLKFGGCQALNLLPGTELFVLTLGDGTILPASEMTLKSVSTESLSGNAEAVKGSEKFDGHAIVASFESKKLNVEWRAVLRDGSHYFRTEMTITPAKSNVEMKSITAMLYEVKNVEGHQSPAVVGNTRGAIIASDLIFAGLETPMGKNTVVSETAGYESFTPTSWTPESFNWEPGVNTPADILKLKTIAGNKTLAADNIVATRGYATFRDAGEQTLTFNYSSGSHRLNLVGVDVCDPVSGQIIASDYHAGFTGSQHQANEYTLNLPEKGTYILRYFVEILSESITSSGTVTFSRPIAIPEIHFGEAPKAESMPMRRVLSSTTTTAMADGDTETDSWSSTGWTMTGEENIPYRVKELGVNTSDVRHMERKVSFAEAADLTVEFLYTSGNSRLDICGVDLVDAEGNPIAYDYHTGFSGTNKKDNVYKLPVPYPGEFTLRYFCSNADNAMNTNGNINLSYAKTFIVYLPNPESQTIQGVWNRATTLQKGNSWKVSSVVGVMAPGQERRSVACYVDRERAVPWRSFPLYNSWFELNINRNNDKDYKTNMTSKQCVNVVKQWRKKLYEAYGANVCTFMWDDGWDFYGTWDFNPNFPNGFSDIDVAASEMNSAIGAWLGPVGGYGQSGNYRRQYWADKGGMQLSNPDYYDVFLTQCSYMLNNYNFNFFKFDGISAISSATGPDPNNEEGAEGIIDIEYKLREIKPDVFLNTTVGTWASPFWYSISDCIWRQEGDYGKIGNNKIDREQWITYRDRLVYQNYVSNSPLCPINAIMTHGLILTSHENPCKYSQKYEDVLREMRCAFVCGTNMVELYTDYALMNSIKGDGVKGKLWEDMAECIFWHKNNEDVLPDAHWVGGNPWNGTSHEVYGWASWNGVKSTLALRNGDNNSQTFKTTLRKALDIPSHISGSIRLKHSFKVQEALEGMPLQEPIDIDRELTLTLPPSSLYCYDGIEANTEWPVYPEPVLPGEEDSLTEIATENSADKTIYDLQGRRVINPTHGLYIQGGKIIKL